MTIAQANITIDQAAHDALRVITNAASDNVKVIAAAAETATKVLATAAAEAVKVQIARSSEDHDLLTELKVRMDGLKADILDIKTSVTTHTDSNTQRICDLELTRSALAGSKSGIQNFWGLIVGGILFLIALISFLYPRIQF